ncbi:MAG: WXG100 family type VII secretion target [Propionibacteriaceae bacterium]|nr:WXG100 family type VII secretion target [Propionibacteriaceae bacterium]
MSEPVDDLTEPQPVALMPNWMDELILNAGGLFSPSGWMLKAIELIPRAKEAIDQFEYWLAGDWNSVLTMADAIKKLSQFTGDLADEVHVAAVNCSADWEGNAADAAFAYFERLQHAIEAHEKALQSVGQDIENVAFGMQSQAQAVEDAATSVLDWVIAIAASAAAAALASSTGVGAASWAVVALEVLAATNTVGKLFKAFGLMDDIVNGVDSTIIRYMADFQSKTELELPDPPR